MVRTFVLLCGKHNSGKTETLRKLFNMSGRQQFKKIIINGKNVFIYMTGSPQELSNFDVRGTIKNIQRRIERCDRESGYSRNYILVMAFTIKKKKERCVKVPINWLKRRGSVKMIYLRKLDFADLLMEDLKTTEIKSIEEDTPRQSRELRRFIKSL